MNPVDRRIQNDLPCESIPADELIELASDAALAIDDQQIVVGWNRSAERLTGYAPEEAIGRRCAELLQAQLPDGTPLCKPDCELFRCLCDCLPRGVTSCRLRHKNGDPVNVGYSSLLTARHGTAGRRRGIVAIILLHALEEAGDRPAAPPALRIGTLGQFNLSVDGRRLPIEKWKRKQAVTLLKYLVTQVDRPVHRERILDCLWPDADEERGWGRLKVTMCYLRRQLRSAGLDDQILSTLGDAYLLRREAVCVDAEVFERWVHQGNAYQQQGRPQEALHYYKQAAELYRGDYLEQDVFADWCAEERSRLSEICLEMYAAAAECHAQLGQYEEAVQTCRKALVCDPCRESLHCALMGYYLRLGRADRAVAQYRQCEAVLAREFGVEPLLDTRRLYRQILDGCHPVAPRAHPGTHYAAPTARTGART